MQQHRVLYGCFVRSRASFPKKASKNRRTYDLRPILKIVYKYIISVNYDHFHHFQAFFECRNEKRPPKTGALTCLTYRYCREEAGSPLLRIRISFSVIVKAQALKDLSRYPARVVRASFECPVRSYAASRSHSRRHRSCPSCSSRYRLWQN